MKFKPSTIKSSLIGIIILSVLLSPAIGAIHHLKMASEALVDSNRIIVATPDNFNPARENAYPFIIMLHGWSGDETQWEDDADLQLLADTYDILLILPDGGYDGWWIDTERLPGRNFDTYIHHELKQWVAEAYHGSTRPTQHGIMGLSMGGYGAILQAFFHPADYAAASSLSGVMDILPRKEKWGLKLALGLQEDNKDNWKAVNPVDMVTSLDPEILPPLQLICGRDDFVFNENVAIVKKFKDSGFEVAFQEEAGKHSHTFWKTHVYASIAFIVSHFK